MEEQRLHPRTDLEETGRNQKNDSEGKAQANAAPLGKKFIPYFVSVLMQIYRFWRIKFVKQPLDSINHIRDRGVFTPRPHLWYSKLICFHAKL